MITSSGTPGSPVKLLIVDDHLVLRQALTEAFAHKGRFKIVGEASDGVAMFDILSRTSADLLILDLAMPKIGGVATIEELKRRGINVPVLILSADESERSIRTALKAGARGFVPKNVGLSELEFAIDAVMKGQTYLSPTVTERLMGNGGKAEDIESPVDLLSKREREILELLASGKKNRDIGKMLHISTRTVDTHRSNILKKLNVKTNAELVRLAISNGMITA